MVSFRLACTQRLRAKRNAGCPESFFSSVLCGDTIPPGFKHAGAGLESSGNDGFFTKQSSKAHKKRQAGGPACLSNRKETTD